MRCVCGSERPEDIPLAAIYAETALSKQIRTFVRPLRLRLGHGTTRAPCHHRLCDIQAPASAALENNPGKDSSFSSLPTSQTKILIPNNPPQTRLQGNKRFSIRQKLNLLQNQLFKRAKVTVIIYNLTKNFLYLHKTDEKYGGFITICYHSII